MCLLGLSSGRAVAVCRRVFYPTAKGSILTPLPSPLDGLRKSDTLSSSKTVYLNLCQTAAR